MILDNQYYSIKICRKAMQDYYNSKGYLCKVGQEIKVNAKDLSPQSHLKVKYVCDYCGKEFSRIVYSNERSKKNGNNKDACQKCSSKKMKESCLLKYGVENAMQVPEIQQKCEQSRTTQNFEGSSFKSSAYFVNGIPVSAAQDNLYQLLKNFELNYHYRKYYLDLAKDDVCIEYNGKGHDMEVRLNKISLENFSLKEEKKKQEVLENYRLLIIEDKKDKFKKIGFIEENYLSQIQSFIMSDDHYKRIEVI